MMVRAVGLEPTLLSEPDFESGASTNSTTPARHWRPQTDRHISRGRPAVNCRVARGVETA